MIAVFAGPTITHAQIQQHLECVCYPPVAHGDILRVLNDKPRVIVIIDGYFEGAPSVWHKEILYAMDQGVHVIGCSSMGALRAAELHQFGMVGVGTIFDWYKEGVIDADDEVAVLHGPAEVGYMVASEPLVNIRATLALALEQNRLSKTQTDALIDAAKNIFYKQRGWTSFLEFSAEFMAEFSLTNELISWLKINRIDLKEQDALLTLEMLKENQQDYAQAYKNEHYHFQWTHVWNGAMTRTEYALQASTPISVNDKKVLDQLKLTPECYERYRDKALVAWLADNPVRLVESDIDAKFALRQFRDDNRLRDRSELIDYMASNELDEASLTTLLQGVSRVELVRETAGELHAHIIDVLRLNGQFNALLSAANKKQAVLEAANITFNTSGVIPPQALSWYFGTQLAVILPKNLEPHLRRVDIKSLEEFYQLIGNEYLYWRENS